MTVDEWKNLNQYTLLIKTVEEVEIERTYPDDGRVPHVPFGFGNAKWVELKSQM